MSLETYIPLTQERLLRHARAVSGNRTVAEDLVQEAFTRAAAGSWRGGNLYQFLTWAKTVIRTAYIDIDRYHAQPISIDDDEDGDLADILFAQPTFTTYYTANEIGVVLRDFYRAWNALTDHQQTLLSATVIDGLSYKEAAQAFNMPIGTIMSQLSRARTTLRLFMDEGVQGI